MSIAEPMRYSGETYEFVITRGDGERYIPNDTNWFELRKQYANVEGSLPWLHMQQPLPWYYASYCLGTSDDNQKNIDYLSIDETKDIVSEMLKYGRSCDWAQRLNVSRTIVSYWKSGYRQMRCDLAEQIRGMLSA